MPIQKEACFRGAVVRLCFGGRGSPQGPLPAANTNGATALWVAAAGDHAEVIAVLAAHGADVNRAKGPGWGRGDLSGSIWCGVGSGAVSAVDGNTDGGSDGRHTIGFWCPRVALRWVHMAR